MIEIIETKQVPIKSLKVLAKNPNQSDIDRMVKSLGQGQWKPIVVNVGTHTGRKNEILGGNRTWLAARRLGWKQITASFVDVDEETAAVIVINDNASGDRREYDYSIYAELIESLPDVNALVIEQDEADEIVERAMKAASDSMDAMRKQESLDHAGDSDDEDSSGSGDGDSDGDYDVKMTVAQMEEQVRLQGVLEAKEGVLYSGDNRWGISDLREDMLMSLSDWPKEIVTWAGYEWLSQHSPDDGKRWYFYNFGLIGRKGLPLDRTVLACNTYDHKFEQLWDMPAYWISQLIAAGLRYSVVPDFSFYDDMTDFEHLYGVYKAQWIGRFMQEAGVRVVPRVQFKDETSLDFCMMGIPKNPPLLHCSIQNIKGTGSDRAKDMALIKKCLQACVDEIDPVEGLIVYGGSPGKTILDQIRLPKGVKKIWVENYAAVRRGSVYDKGKKGVNAVLPAKERKRIKTEAKQAELERLGDTVKRVARDEDDE